MNDRRKIISDPMYWMKKEPNFARLQMAVCRGAFIYGKDHVKILNTLQRLNDIEAEMGD